MKTLLKWIQAHSIASAVIALVLFMGLDQVTVGPRLGLATAKYTGTYASAQSDTVIFQREGGVSALSFGIRTGDSSNITHVIVRRVIDGVASPAIAGDTLVTSDSSATARSIVKTVTMAPIPDTYWFVVLWGTDNGGIDQGNSPTLTYEVNKQYAGYPR